MAPNQEMMPKGYTTFDRGASEVPKSFSHRAKAGLALALVLVACSGAVVLLRGSSVQEPGVESQVAAQNVPEEMKQQTCTVTFMYRNLNGDDDRDISKTFTANVDANAELAASYYIEYSDKAGEYPESSNSFAARDSTMVYTDSFGQTVTVPLIDNSGAAHYVENVRFSRNCPTKLNEHKYGAAASDSRFGVASSSTCQGMSIYAQGEGCDNTERSCLSGGSCGCAKIWHGDGGSFDGPTSVVFEAGMLTTDPGYFDMISSVNAGVQDAPYCRVENANMGSYSSNAFCGTGVSNIGFKITVHFNAPIAGDWKFDINGDFGRGAIAVLDSQTSDCSTCGIWQNLASYPNFGAFSNVPTGPHTLTIYGAEDCCDGTGQITFQGPGDTSTHALTEYNLNMYQAAVAPKDGYNKHPATYPQTYSRGTVVVRYTSSMDAYGSAAFLDEKYFHYDGGLDDLEQYILNTPVGYIIAMATLDEPFEHWSGAIGAQLSDALGSMGMDGFPVSPVYRGAMAGVGVAGCRAAGRCPSFTGFTFVDRYSADPAKYAAHVSGCNSCAATQFTYDYCGETSVGGTCSMTCPAGMTGAPTDAACSTASGTPSWSNVITCADVACPDGSTGSSVRAGCTCKDGYTGSISAGVGGYVGTCSPVPCPAYSNGLNVISGCTCNPGFAGTIAASYQGVSGSCATVSPPSGAQSTIYLGEGVYFCNANEGYCGSEAAGLNGANFAAYETCGSLRSVTGGFEGSCAPVECPEFSTGDNIGTGCVCDAGFVGLIEIDTSSATGYRGSCDAAACPENSFGISVNDGCTCDAGHAGIIMPGSTEVGGFTGRCELVSCDAVSNVMGVDVVSGCTCNAGFLGSVTAIVHETTPYENSCQSVNCPRDSWGTSVVDGCTCNPGFEGTIVPAVGGRGMTEESGCTDINECMVPAEPCAFQSFEFSTSDCGTGQEVPEDECFEAAVFQHYKACPYGTSEVSGGNDILGCGLEDCSERYVYADAISCAMHCENTEGCIAFSFAPIGDDVSHPESAVCSMYNSSFTNSSAGPEQILCIPIEDASMLVGKFNGIPAGCSLRADAPRVIFNTNSEPEGVDFTEYVSICRAARAPCDNLENNFYCHCDSNHAGTTCSETHADCDAVGICGRGSCVEQVRTEDGQAAYTCDCEAGFFQMPGDETCDQAAQCPVNSHGSSVDEGCTCNTGFSAGKDVIGSKSGVIVPITDAPYYAGECLPDPCMSEPVVQYMLPSNCTGTASGAYCKILTEHGFHTHEEAECVEGKWISVPDSHVTNVAGALTYCNLYPDLMVAFCENGECSIEAQARLCQHHFNEFGKDERRDENGLRSPGQLWGAPALMHPCSTDPEILNLDAEKSICEGTASDSECAITCAAGRMPTPNAQAKCIGKTWENDAGDIRNCEPVACPSWTATDEWVIDAPQLTLAPTGDMLTDMAGCDCHKRLHGEIFATQFSPFFEQTCEPNDCTIPTIFEGRLGDKKSSIALWTGDKCLKDATDVAHGTVCEIVPNFGWTCTSPGRCVAEQFDANALCTPNDCAIPRLEDASVAPGLFGEGIEAWNLDACAGDKVVHETVCEITPEFGYDCVSPGECYAEVLDNVPSCEAYVCVRPETEERTTKHGVTWSRNDGYIFNEVDTRAAERYWDVTATCAPGFVGTPKVGICLGGAGSAYSISGCNLDTDLDGIADDDEECETDPLKTECGICGCHEVDYDEETGTDNCATIGSIGTENADASFFYVVRSKDWDAKSVTLGNEFTASEGGCKWLDLKGWTQQGSFGAMKDNYAWSSRDGAGYIISASFVIRASTLAFEAGYGSGGSIVELMTQDDDGRFLHVRKSLVPTETAPLQHFWDVSGLMQEMAVLKITNKVEGQRMHVNNIRMFDGDQGCIADCMTIEPDTNIKGNLKIMGTAYEPVNEGTSFSDNVAALYCVKDNTGRVSPGAAAGATFADNYPVGMKYTNLDVAHLPSCVMVRQLKESTFEIAVETGKQRFSYSSMYTPDSVESKNLHCVYPTVQPRCIDYFGILTDMRQADMFCAEVEPAVVCVETALASKCPLKADVLCGKEKMERDLLECCDKDGNHANNGCLGRRRLGETIRVSDDLVLDMDTAEGCARACFKQPDDITCHAWRLDDFDLSCKLARKCYPKHAPQVENLGLARKRWSLATPDTNPFKGMKMGRKSTVEV